jgi:hypothetical protein
MPSRNHADATLQKNPVVAVYNHFFVCSANQVGKVRKVGNSCESGWSEACAAENKP